jgi:hypothetical protein
VAPDDVETVPGPSIPQRIAQASVVLAVLSVGLTLVGLGGLAIDARPYGRMLLTLGIAGATIALVVTAAASAFDKSIRGEEDEDAEEDVTQPY